MWRWQARWACGVLGVAALGVACTPERTRAIAAPRDAVEVSGAAADTSTATRLTVTKSTDAIVVDLANALDRFRTSQGRMPRNLNELVTSGILKRLPPKPQGLDYRYDASTGNISFVPVDDSGQIRIPDDTYEAPSLLQR